MPPSLDIVIVNWNAGNLLRRCIGSIGSALTGGFTLNRLVVVDNASTDGSADHLPGNGLPLTVLRNDRNRGFAAACNQGAVDSRADHILFLNPDTELGPASLAPALAFLEEPANARVGIVGIRLRGEDGAIQRSCARAPTPSRLMAQSVGLDRAMPKQFPPHFMQEWDHGDTRPVDQVMGAFLLIRSSLFESLGGFDERYFVYFDDVDLCLSARRAGWEVVHFAGAEARHKGCGTTEGIKDIRLFYSLRSRLLFSGKHFGPMATVAVAIATAIVEPMVRIAHAIRRGVPGEAAAAWRGARLLWADLPAILPQLFRPPPPSRPMDNHPTGNR
ncbi:glycosyltransferase family 2 protein [Azospirillum agricola]|uniref:glycosyltransferase family 2 protein n=1 Tax=Azospirillum agricola TaxID=1720247 RepID=UPI000A0F39EA|nr:glycosyltransferase family 2 protein [Azospirillum agricola]SMH41915.1 hypothetical protein SAMN02982994_1788 [Azospirillum lipoferum]